MLRIPGFDICAMLHSISETTEVSNLSTCLSAHRITETDKQKWKYGSKRVGRIVTVDECFGIKISQGTPLDSGVFFSTDGWLEVVFVLFDVVFVLSLFRDYQERVV